MNSSNQTNNKLSPKTILLAVIGLSPQVLTETLYALHQNNKEVNCIHVITTREGKNKIFSELLAGKDGQFHQYLNDYGFDPQEIEFNHDNVHIIQNDSGEALNDIITVSDNELLLKTCLELTFRLTKYSNYTVYFSVAGGRKTMSSCLTLAAQLFGRPQDRIYHVIVSPEFESNPNFFYPPAQSTKIVLYDKKGQPFYKESQYAKIYLINIPFVSVRDKLLAEKFTAPFDSLDILNNLIRDNDRLLRVDLVSKKLIYNQIQMNMKPAHLALYALFAKEKKECNKISKNCSQCQECFIDIEQIFARQDQITHLYSSIKRQKSLKNLSDTGITNLSAENFNMYKGKIKKALEKTYGAFALTELEIASLGTKPNVHYGLRIDKKRIEIVY